MNIPFVEQEDNKEILLNFNKLSSGTMNFVFNDCWELAVIYKLRSFMQRRYETSSNLDQICREFRKFNFILCKLPNLMPASIVRTWNRYNIDGKPFFSYMFHSILPYPDEFDENKILPNLRKNFYDKDNYSKDKLYNAIIKLITTDREKLVI